MAIEVFWGSGGGPAWRVLLTLAIKGVPYESHLLSFAKREHKSLEILAMTVRGKLPVLRDGSYTLYESLAILTYLDRKHPTPPIFGTTPEDAGTIMRMIMEHECYGAPAFSAVTRPILFGKIEEQRDQVTAALPLFRDELKRIEEELENRTWFVGDTVSAADIFVFPMIKMIERSLAKPGAETFAHDVLPLRDSFPKIAAWVARIEALPGYEATYPPHWREG